MTERLLDRLEDCVRKFPTALVLGGAGGGGGRGGTGAGRGRWGWGGTGGGCWQLGEG